MVHHRPLLLALVHLLVPHQHFGQLRLDLETGVERGHRVLEDHGDVAAAILVERIGRHADEVDAPSIARPVARPLRASSPMMARKAWLLPEPLSPTTASVSPRESEKLRSEPLAPRTGAAQR